MTSYILSHGAFTETATGLHFEARTIETGPMFSGPVSAGDALVRFKCSGAADARLHILTPAQAREQKSRRLQNVGA